MNYILDLTEEQFNEISKKYNLKINYKRTVETNDYVWVKYDGKEFNYNDIVEKDKAISLIKEKIGVIKNIEKNVEDYMSLLFNRIKMIKVYTINAH